MFSLSFRRISAYLAAYIALMTVVVSPGPAVDAQSQVNEPPIILEIGGTGMGSFYVAGKVLDGGDLWEWVGQGKPLKQLTNWHYNLAPVLSPDGNQVAYLSLANFAVQDLKQNPKGCCAFFPPLNVWVLNLRTGNAVRIADQPPSADDSNLQGIYRPAPTWSPDSTQLAWIEQSVGESPDYTLKVYDVAAQKAKMTVENVPDTEGGEGASSTKLSWSTAGLTYFGSTFDAASNTVTLMLYRYTSDGKQVAAVQLSALPNDINLINWANVDTHPVAVFGLDSPGQTNVAIDYIYDPADNSIKALSGQLQAYSPTAPQGIALDAGYSLDSNQYPIRTWTLPGRSVSLLEPIALSPDGKYVAAISRDKQNQITLYDQQGNATPIDLKLADAQSLDWLGWGPIAYRTRAGH